MKNVLSLDSSRAIEQALTMGEITVFYQPQIAIPSYDVCGLEALVRWNHPIHGLLSPAAFLPEVERHGLIYALDAYVRAQVVADLVDFRVKKPRLIASVNVAAIEFLHGSLREELARLTQDHGLSPDALQLELLEQTLLDESADELIHALRADGYALALDDFGTGYASIRYLSRFVFRELKIDASFIRSMTTSHRAQALVSGMVQLGHALHMRVLAEGVETHTQLALLSAMGVDRVQGFLMGRPVMKKTLLDTWETTRSVSLISREP